MRQIFSTFEESYLAHTHNRTTNSINETVSDVLNHLQDKYSQVIPHDYLECEDIIKNTTYHPQDMTVTVLSAVK